MVSTKIFEAAKLATLVHKNQTRKDGTPYIDHPFAVAFIVSRYTTDEDLIIAGLLHDVIEDVDKAEYSEAQMLKDFGPKIFRIVSDLSDKRDPMSDADEIKTWKERKTKYLNHLKVCELDSLLVCCADKIHNFYDSSKVLKIIGEDLWTRFHASKSEEFWYMTSCYEIINSRMPGAMADELKYYVEEVKKLSPL